MSRWTDWVRRRAMRRDDRGFTLVEVVIAVVILGGITAAVTASLVTALHGSGVTTQKVRESNDAQLISAFLVRDAQAAGGTSPLTGSVDPTIGVYVGDSSVCTASGATPVVRFTWVDRSSPATAITRTASYYRNVTSNELVRQTCSSPAQPNDGAIVLGRHVAAATAACTPAADCPGLPDTVAVTITETNNPQNAPTPYTYTLTASLRPEAQTTPSRDNAEVAPLVALGGSCTDSGLVVQGNTDVSVTGGTIVNASDVAGTCTGLTVTGASTYGSSSTSAVGTCSGNNCPAITPIGSPIPDPLAGLPPMPGVTCGAGGSNPTPVSGHYTAVGGTMVFPQPVGITGTVTFDPGIYIFCSGVTFNSNSNVTGNHALFYIHGGALTMNGQSTIAMSSYTASPYTNLLIWQPSANTATMNIAGGASINTPNTYSGWVYVPGATVAVGGGSGAVVAAIIAKRIVFTGGGDVAVGPPPPLVIATASFPTATRGVAYSTTVTAAYGTPPYVNWTAAGLPAGLSIDAATGVISGTPTTAGNYSVTVGVGDSGAPPDATTRDLSLTVAAPALTITTNSLNAWTVNRTYPSVTFAANGGTPPYVNWTSTGLPAGLTLAAATGELSGTPTVTGTFNVNVVVTDSAGATANRGYTLTINGPPTVSTVSLPNAGQNRPYTVTMAATGGTGPYGGWTATGLPAGLGINPATGVISGTTAATGSFTVTVTVTDAAGAVSAPRSYSLTVVPPPRPTAIARTNGNGTVATGDTVTITFSDPMSVSSFCSAWTNDANNQTLDVNGQVTVTISNTGGNDTLAVSSTACTFNLGSILLGGDYVSADKTFAGNGGNKSTIVWNVAARTLTITLGSPGNGPGINVGVPQGAPVYTPSAAITNTTAVPIDTAPFTGAASRF